jgi:hypothetical protein
VVVNRRFLLLLIVGVFAVAIARAQDSAQEMIPNWPAPATWSPHGASRGVSTQSFSSPFPFVAVTPCRVADTRGNGFTGAYGPPSIAANTTRTFVISGQCGIPANAAAVSFNFTALDIVAAGDLRVFPAGAAAPLVSTLNYNANTPNIANAAIVPLGTSGGITVQADATTINLIIDVNGYYGPGLGSGNTFLGSIAGNYTLTGGGNTGIGNAALFNNSSGSSNTALGQNALGNNTVGSFNTAIGASTLLGTNGTNNVAVGYQALQNAGGGSNIALGTGAGINLTAGGFNMDLGNEGLDGESTTIRIGSGSVHTRLFVAGVLTSGVAGATVLISNTGQLGIATSSARYKEEIRDMGDASDRLSKLRPVTFRYKGHADDPIQFGLIAEEVEKVLPELVFHSASGRPESVLYQEMPAMLLNELQKQQREIQELKSEIAALRAAIGQK